MKNPYDYQAEPSLYLAWEAGVRESAETEVSERPRAGTEEYRAYIDGRLSQRNRKAGVL